MSKVKSQKTKIENQKLKVKRQNLNVKLKSQNDPVKKFMWRTLIIHVCSCENYGVDHVKVTVSFM